MSQQLQPLPYHLRLRDYLKGNHRDVWDWFSSAEAASDHSDAVQLELLKSTYRLDPNDHGGIYSMVDEVKEKLQLQVPVTLYQMQDGGGQSQAALYFTPGHGHVVFGGNILQLLDEPERRALIGHELAHFKLWTEEDGEFLVAERILISMSNDSGAEPSHFESARLYRLFTEIYADRGSLIVSDSADAAIGALIKTATGTSDVSPASYLAQAEEVVARSGTKIKSDGYTHPEEFIRVKATHLWSVCNEKDEAEAFAAADEEIESLIIGNCALNSLDLTQQDQLTQWVRELLRHLLEPEWARTGRSVAHAKLFFSDFKPDEERVFSSLEELAEEIGPIDDKAKHFLAHLLLDFAVADRDLEENGIALGLRASDILGVASEYEAAARKELKILKRDLTALRKDIEDRFKRAADEYAKLTDKERREVED